MLIDALVGVMNDNNISTFEDLSQLLGVPHSTIMNYVKSPDTIPVSFMILFFKFITVDRVTRNKIYHIYVDTVLEV